MAAMQQLSDELLQNEYKVWFKQEYGVPPVITSSTGWPAVRFAQHVLKRFAHLNEQEES